MMPEVFEGSVSMCKVYDVRFIDKDGFWNHKVLEADSESDVSDYMHGNGVSVFDISER